MYNRQSTELYTKCCFVEIRRKELCNTSAQTTVYNSITEIKSTM